MPVDALLQGLDSDQLAAVTAEESLVAVVAAAGSGKTMVVTRRIAHRILSEQADEEHVLAVTFTRQAAGELRRRLVGLGLRGDLTVGTFHSVAYGLLRRRWADQSRSAPSLLTNRHGYLRDVLGPDHARIDPSALAAELEWMRAQALTPERYATVASERGRRPAIPPARVAELLTAFDALKRKRGVVDFDDLLLQCADELRRDRDFAAATRWRFRHLLVDEFQDINPAQFALLELIRGERTDLCVVGDPRQAIYGWNGADPTLLDRVEQTYPGVRVVRLRSNYRCAPAVVTAAAQVLGTAGHTDDSRAARPDGPAVELLGSPDESAEAAAIARRVRDLRPPGGRWRSIAVLARTNQQLGPLAAALGAAGIPANLGQRAHASDDADRRLLLAEARGMSSPDTLRMWATDLAAGIDGGAPTALHRELAESVRRFLAASPSGTGRSFAEWHAVDATVHVPADGVELLTFHAAKGREWRSVIVAGVEVGLVPHAGAGSAGAAEEARLLYVAITRAADTAVITWAEQRYGRPSGRSPLLRSITARADAEPAMPAFLPGRTEGAASRAGTSDPVLVALRGWRSRAARAARLPEASVCTDSELSAIAAARPRSVDELVDVPGMSALAARRLGPRLIDVVSSALAVEPTDP
ncbi:MAG: UvrD-helicase domain-containing protein [Acidimicrobiia bacterium]